MGKPAIGNPPTEQEMIEMVELQIDDKYSYGPLKHRKTADGILFFQSETVPVQVEIETEGGKWGEKFEALRYKVYEIPPSDDSFSKEQRSPYDVAFNPDLTWESAVSRTIMSISGAINGALRSGKIDIDD